MRAVGRLSSQNLPLGPCRGFTATAFLSGSNLIEKIVSKYVVQQKGSVESVRAGDYVSLRPAHVMTHDNTAAVMAKFLGLKATKFANSKQPIFTLDHNVQDKSEANLKKYALIEAFAAQHGVDFYPAGRGIGHQIMCEEGYAFPGTLVVGSDSHSNMYGGLGCLGTPVVRTDAAGIWATSTTWWKVPQVTRVILSGKLAPGVTGKDVIVTLCGLYKNDEVLNHAVEFVGDGVASLSIDDRLTIANMTTEWGALAGVFPIDDRLFQWLDDRSKLLAARLGKPHPRYNANTIAALKQNPLSADRDAYYVQDLHLDLSLVRPYVSGPNHVKVMTSVADLEAKGVPIQKAYIVSCVNSRTSDLAAAAEVLRGKKIAPSVKLYVAAASSEVEQDSKARGDWDAILAAGATALPPGCGPCIGLGTGLLEDGEVGISATNRNFKGRMGSRNAECYLASPAVVAASAIAGKVCAPDSLTKGAVPQLTPKRTLNKSVSSSSTAAVEIVSGFPESIEGHLGNVVLIPTDNINTDGIYAGTHTYVELSPEKQASVLMENYDPNFNSIVQKGDIVIGGYNFGTGSSREQAVTAFKHRGVALLIAGSFSETYIRNAINNGYICIELPELVDTLKKAVEAGTLTKRLSSILTVDFKNSLVKFEGKTYSMSAIGPAVQEIIVAGGLEPWLVQQIQRSQAL